jgi:hypothetical protein
MMNSNAVFVVALGAIVLTGVLVELARLEQRAVKLDQRLANLERQDFRPRGDGSQGLNTEPVASESWLERNILLIGIGISGTILLIVTYSLANARAVGRA